MRVMLTATQMRELDRRAIQEAGVSSLDLMEQAAQAVADAAWAMGGRGKHFAVFCGTGNNGGDGLAAARLLLERGGQVRVFLVGDRAALTPDAGEMARRLTDLGAQIEALGAFEADVVVDALFGVGLSRPVEGAYRAAVEAMGASGAKVVSADLPSGVETDTGRVLGAAVRADVTVTFTALKPGLMAGEGAVLAGKVQVAPIGIPKDLYQRACQESKLYTMEPGDAALPRRPRDSHKGDYGKLLILAGAVGYTGAPVLAASAALRSGAGLITLATPAAAWPVVASRCLEVMVLPLPDDGAGRLSAAACPSLPALLAGRTAVLLGPGLGRSPGVEAAVWAALEGAGCPAVVDADGLNAVAAHIDRLKGRDWPTVLTPHDGEFTRLGGDLSAGDRLGAARDLAARTGCIVVLKGYRTVTAFPDGTCAVNTTGNPGMAKGGSGDILAGMIAGFLAQGISVREAAMCGVYLHGLAGDRCEERLSRTAMLPSELFTDLCNIFLKHGR